MCEREVGTSHRTQCEETHKDGNVNSIPVSCYKVKETIRDKLVLSGQLPK